MQRIAIVGNGGAGKTVLANKLGRLIGIAVTHLDALRYAEDWTPVSEQVFVARQREVMAAGRWIIDGNSLVSLAGRVGAVDTVIVVDPPPLVCLWGILPRMLCYHGGRHPDGVHDRITSEFLHYVCRYRRDHLPRALACISEHTCGAQVVHLTSRGSPGRDPGPHARHPHPSRRPMAEGIRRRLGRLRRRRQPPDTVIAAAIACK